MAMQNAHGPVRACKCYSVKVQTKVPKSVSKSLLVNWKDIGAPGFITGESRGTISHAKGNGSVLTSNENVPKQLSLLVLYNIRACFKRIDHIARKGELLHPDFK